VMHVPATKWLVFGRSALAVGSAQPSRIASKGRKIVSLAAVFLRMKKTVDRIVRRSSLLENNINRGERARNARGDAKWMEISMH
ncbi:MAG: hypothetical protein WBH14_13220, partial [Albidovulum sp.]